MTDRPDQENRSPGRPPKTGDLRRDTRPLGRKRPGWVQHMASPRQLSGIALASLVLLLAAAAGWWYFLGRFAGPGGEEAPFTPPASLDNLATEYPELAVILQDPNMDSAYKEFLLAYETGGEEAALELAQERGLLNANGDLRLTLELDTTDTAGLEAELEANWIEVTAVSGNLMDIAIPLERLEMMMAAGTIGDFISGITTLEHVVRIRLPKVGVSDAAGLQTTPEPTTQAPATAAATSEPVGGWQSPNNFLVVILGALACVVAPVLFALGAYLLLSGMGFIRRGRKGDPLGDSGLRPSGFTPPSPPDQRPAPPNRPVQASGSHTPVKPPSVPAPSEMPPAGASPSPFSQSQPAPRPARPEPSPAGDRPGPPGTGPLPSELKPEAQTDRGRPAAGDPTELQPCPNCGRANRKSAKFCLACGTRLETSPEAHPASDLTAEDAPPPVIPVAPAAPAAEPSEHPRFCWNCGTALRPSSRFCPHCGDSV